MYWVHPAVYLLLLAGFIILLIVYLVVRKKAEVNPGLCETHKKRRLIGLLYGWLGFLAGFCIAILGGSSHTPAAMVFGLLMMISAIVVGMLWGRLIYVKKITQDEVRLGGFSADYLDDLPDYPR